METISPLVQALLVVNPLLSVLVGASLWFGLGGRLGKLEATTNGYKDMAKEQVEQLRKERAECRAAEEEKMRDHEERLRKLELG